MPSAKKRNKDTVKDKYLSLEIEPKSFEPFENYGGFLDKKGKKKKLKKINKTVTELRTQAILETISNFDGNLEPEDDLAVSMACAAIYKFKVASVTKVKSKKRKLYEPQAGRGDNNYKAERLLLSQWSEELRLGQVTQLLLADKVNGDPELLSALKSAAKSEKWGKPDSELSLLYQQHDIKVPFYNLRDILKPKSIVNKINRIIEFVDSFKPDSSD